MYPMIKMFLTLIKWTDKATGEARAMYAFVCNPVVSINLPNQMTGTFRPVEKTDSDVAPIWVPEMTEKMFDIYVGKGYDVIEFDVEEPTTITYCGANFNAEATQSAEPIQPSA